MHSESAAGAEGVRWDLTLLAPSEQAMKERLRAAVTSAHSFCERWSTESIATIEPEELVLVLSELAEVRAARSEGELWVFLLAQTDGENPAVRDLQAWVNERLPSLDEALRHFEHSWVHLSSERAEVLANTQAVAGDRHYLLSLRRFSPFMLSAQEERVLAAREATANIAWQTLYARTLSSLTARFDDGTGERDWSFSELEPVRRSHPDRDLRRRAWGASQEAIEPVLPLLAQCYDALVADRLAVDRVRGHKDAMERPNLENDIEPGVVEHLLEATQANHRLCHRWFELKADLLGLERLDSIDLFAPVFEEPVIHWEDGHRLAVSVFAKLTPTLAREAQAFFADPRIDAEPRRGKASGAMCNWPSTRSTGFLNMNWSGSALDLAILVHELGHGTHFALAAHAQSEHSFLPGLAVGEIPSTFAHMRLVDDLWAVDPALARPVLSSTLDTAALYVFVRTGLTRYEQSAYALRDAGETLTVGRLNHLCEAELTEVWGDAMSDVEGHRQTMWAPFTHTIYFRFYLYGYAFAFLIAAGLLGRSRGGGFAERYERFLAAGGSASTDELMRLLDVDVNQPDIWEEGFSVIEGWIDRLSA